MNVMLVSVSLSAPREIGLRAGRSARESVT